MVDIGAFALETTARELAAWQKALEVNPPIFATVAASSRQMLGHDLLTDVRAALSRHFVQRGSLKIAVAENLVMENPEYAARCSCRRVREVGAALDARPIRRGLYLARPPAAVPLRRAEDRRLAASVRTPSARVRRFCARSSQWPTRWGWTSFPRGRSTESDAVELAQIGCQFGQGAAFGQPMSAAAARSSWARRRRDTLFDAWVKRKAIAKAD